MADAVRDSTYERLTSAQLLATARAAGGLVTHRWFGERFNVDEEPYFVRLFLGVYVNYGAGRVPTQKEATQFIGPEQNKTTGKYLKRAEDLGYLKVIRSKHDRRKKLVYPTEKLISLLEEELQGIGKWFNGLSSWLSRASRNASLELYPVVPIALAQLAFSPPTIKTGTHWELDPEQVIAEATQAIQLAPTSAMMFEERGRALAQLGRLDEAVSDLEKAVRLRPTAARIFEQLARYYLRLKRLPEALHAADKAVETAPKWEKVYARRALVWVMLNELEKAKGDVERAKKLGWSVSDLQFEDGVPYIELEYPDMDTNKMFGDGR